MKTKHYFLVAFFVLVIAVFSYFYYLFNVKEYELVDDKVAELTSSEFQVILPLGSFTDERTNIADNTLLTEEIVIEEADILAEPIEREVTEIKESKPVIAPLPPSEESIITSYLTAFEDLEGQANERLNALVKRAFEEFKEKRAKGESISFPYFYTKYKGAGDELEKQADEAFYSIYNTLLQELEKHGYGSAAASQLITHYEEAKKTRQGQLFAKVKEYF